MYIANKITKLNWPSLYTKIRIYRLFTIWSALKKDLELAFGPAPIVGKANQSTNRNDVLCYTESQIAENNQSIREPSPDCASGLKTVDNGLMETPSLFREWLSSSIGMTLTVLPVLRTANQTIRVSYRRSRTESSIPWKETLETAAVSIIMRLAIEIEAIPVCGFSGAGEQGPRRYLQDFISLQQHFHPTFLKIPIYK